SLCLPSSPTRRSSDLVYVIKADGLALWKSRGDGAFPEIISQQTTDPESYFRAITVRGKTVAAVSAMPHSSRRRSSFSARHWSGRSEEHTSELQSRSDL